MFGASLLGIESALLLGSTVSRSVKGNTIDGILDRFFNGSEWFDGFSPSLFDDKLFLSSCLRQGKDVDPGTIMF